MTHELDRDELIDLGPASLETKGSVTGRDDHAGLIPFEGLSEE